MSKETLPHIIEDPNLNPGTAELHTEFNGTPFIVRGEAEDIMAVAATMPINEPVPVHPVSVSKALQTRVEAKPHYVNLAELSGRQAARYALRALKHDALSLGRTSLYRQFKDRLHEEQDLQAMVDLGIVQSVHCRLHEKQLERARS